LIHCLPHKINIVTLGCAKNLVDSEVLVKQLAASGFQIAHNYSDIKARKVIINTCGFINDAKEESIDMILQYVHAKKSGKIDKLYVMGCLSERYKHELQHEIPEVDRYFGVNDVPEILEELGGHYHKELIGKRILSTPNHSAYLKVSEGCDRRCSFCAIPLIRGKQRSKSLGELYSETDYLASNGVRELILIAQDLTAYGNDLYGEQKLVRLLELLDNIRGIEWIRLHYTYPAGFPSGLTEIIRDNPKICNYIDIPFQHISDKVLRKMHRGINRTETISLITRIRETVPGIAIRTTLLVGHPGEGENEFRDLKNFVQTQRFERLGVFRYSEEDGTYAARYFKDEIPERIKQERYEEIMEMQRDISLDINKKKIGETVRVLIDSREGGYAVGRTEFDSPEVDNDILLADPYENLKPGEFHLARITGAAEYELFGELIT
jgi:ribosomal protein S12 methylthiotransferase